MCLIAGGPIPHQLHIRLGLGQLPQQVTMLGAGGHDIVIGRHPSPREVVEPGQHGQVSASALQLRGTGVDLLQVQQPLLVTGVGFHEPHPNGRRSTRTRPRNG